MNRNDVKLANSAFADLDRLSGLKDALKTYEMSSLTLMPLNTGGGASRDAVVFSADETGLGPFASLGFPAALRSALQATISDWIDKRVAEAQGTLKELGINA